MLHFSKWKTALIWLVVLFGVVFSMPNFFTEKQLETWPKTLQNQLNLGLDLQGGAHFLLRMDEGKLFEKWLKSLRGDVREKLRKARIGYSNLKVKNKKEIEVTIRDKAELQKAETELKTIIEPVAGINFSGQGGANLEIKRVEGTETFTITPTEAARRGRMNQAISAGIEVVNRRVNALGTTEPIIQRQGLDRILLQVPGVEDTEGLKKVLKGAGVLSFHLVDTNASATSGVLPPGSSLYKSFIEGEEKGGEPTYVLRDRAIVTGENLDNAQPGFDSQNGEPVVTFRFNASGARRFGRATKENVGKPFAIVLDEKVITAPNIREPILGGSGQISGSFTAQTANELAIKMRSGALPAPLDIIEERSVGASLGADSVRAGAMAAIIGLVAVLFFILMAYGLFGLFANIALLVNIALIVAALSYLQATLTLPGIAGIVLTMGMAVDANVLIFERIREELRAGKPTVRAVEQGYGRALATILDANITTLIAGIILFWLGSGPIRGFAVTLSIGIITSVFTAVTFTRWLVSWWISRQKTKSIPAPI